MIIKMTTINMKLNPNTSVCVIDSSMGKSKYNIGSSQMMIHFQALNMINIIQMIYHDNDNVNIVHYKLKK